MNHYVDHDDDDGLEKSVKSIREAIVRDIFFNRAPMLSVDQND